MRATFSMSSSMRSLRNRAAAGLLPIVEMPMDDRRHNDLADVVNLVYKDVHSLCLVGYQSVERAVVGRRNHDERAFEVFFDVF